MNKKKIYWACQIGGWSLYALVNILPLVFMSHSEFTDFLTHLIMIFFNITITHLFRRHILRNQWLRLYLTRLIWKVFKAVVLMSVVTCGILLVVSLALGTVDFTKDSELLFILGNFIPFLIVYSIWSLVYFIYHHVENYNKSLKYEAVINEIKLNELKSQLNPHFIFNALNSIRALVDEEPRKAKVAVTQLSHILRNTLSMDKKRLIGFEDELKTVKDYLALESIRYEERLQVKMTIDPNSRQFLVPPLMLQTLVENAIKHGISSLINGGLVEITSEVIHDKLCVTIRNSGQYMRDPNRRRLGYGIANTKQRLELLYGAKASFSIFNENEEFVITKVLIPQVIYHESTYSG
jgi:two-component system, LytTR family, sensor kinase